MSKSNLKGIGFLLLAMLIGSLQAVAVKWIGGNYSVLEVVTFRSLVALPINVMWGFLIWHEIPAGMTIVGAALTLLSGLYIFYHEQKPVQNQLIIDNAAMENDA